MCSEVVDTTPNRLPVGVYTLAVPKLAFAQEREISLHRPNNRDSPDPHRRLDPRVSRSTTDRPQPRQQITLVVLPAGDVANDVRKRPHEITPI